MKRSSAARANLKVILQTYFGDVRDCYSDITSLPFDGVGLDFVEGKKTLELVLQNGFPKDKILFVGVVNGKNIWRNHYAKTLDIIEQITPKCGEIVLNTSCSLLHVPYTLDNEAALSADIKKHFAFAGEKLGELEELKKIFSSEEPQTAEEFISNRALMSETRSGENCAVRQRVKELPDKTFTRLPDFLERERIQKTRFKLPAFPTTTIGSFPQTAEVRKRRSEFKKGAISEQQYDDFMKNKIKNCIEWQEKIGLDVLVHGEFERNDMVEYFGECLDEYIFTEKAWVQSYGTRCVKPPVIWGDISRAKPMTVK